MLADWSVQWIPAFWTIWLNIFLCFRIRFDKIDSYIGPVCVLGLFVLTDWMITFHRRSRGNVASNHIVWIRLAGWWLIIPFVHVVMKRCHGNSNQREYPTAHLPLCLHSNIFRFVFLSSRNATRWLISCKYGPRATLFLMLWAQPQRSNNRSCTFDHPRHLLMPL